MGYARQHRLYQCCCSDAVFRPRYRGNWSYNPENYDNNEVPVSVMAKDLLNTYKYGWKTSYYQNTMDGKVEDVIQEPLPQDPFDDDGEDCDACAI